ncbi:MAG: peptidoglycan bridge formation glycyltransferase FemA/FemB family protein, partial [Anaerolineales bacterium]|nr:peptidoglycan bridge formation glycyltransferase FemA/FemB family protein [Anaerolineales bacterium]
MSELSLNTWNTFLANSPHAHLLQTGEWGLLKSAFGWQAVRIVAGEVGAQILFRRLPLGFTLAYMPKGPVFSNQSSVISDQFWAEVDEDCRARHAIFLKIEPDAWEETFNFQPSNLPTFKLSNHNIQPPRTIVISIKDNEETILA